MKRILCIAVLLIVAVSAVPQRRGPQIAEILPQSYDFDGERFNQDAEMVVDPEPTYEFDNMPETPINEEIPAAEFDTDYISPEEEPAPVDPDYIPPAEEEDGINTDQDQDPNLNDDEFIIIRTPTIFRHPFFRPRYPIFFGPNNDGAVVEETETPNRPPSILDMLFPNRRMSPFPGFGFRIHHQFDDETPVVEDEETVGVDGQNIPAEENPQSGSEGHHGIHHFFNDFFNRPIHPFHTAFPSIEHKPEEYPKNYTNSTYNVHEVDGKKYAVNETIRKHSGDNFHNFFHVRVIQHLPDQEGSEPTNTNEAELPEEPTTTTTFTEEDQEPSFRGDIVPEIINEAENELTAPLPVESQVSEAKA